MKRIGLFGGSFDPIHIAHKDVAKYAFNQLDLDEIQLIPTRNNPWKSDSLASADDRIAMILLALQDEENIHLNTIEIDKQSDDKDYTIFTLEQLIKENPGVKYYYIMGMDQANLFYKWKEAKKISELVTLVAFQRGDYEADEKYIQDYHFTVLNNPPMIASSSDVRCGHIELLEPQVLKYITKHGLYLETMLKNQMSEKRWNHTCSVAKLAATIANANHLNGKQAYIAGMFHDIAKEMKHDDAYLIMQEHFPEYLDKPEVIWHQWISRYVSEHTYLIDDQIVLDAIEHHTTGSIHISAIGKCVYVADKLDPLRGYDSSVQIEVCKNDIHEGFRNSLIEFYEFSKSKNRGIDECFYEIYDYFVEKGEI